MSETDDMLKQIDNRLQSLELDYRVTKEVMDTRVKFIEDQVISHMNREDNDFKELKSSLRGLDERLRSVDSLIEERISLCRNDMVSKNREIFATQVDVTRLEGRIMTNTKVMAAAAVVIPIVFTILTFVFKTTGVIS